MLQPLSLAAGNSIQAIVWRSILLWWSAPFAGMAACALLTLVLIKFAPRWGLVSGPRSDRWSRRTVPKFGGVPILLAFVAASLLHKIPSGALPILLLTCAMGLVGLADDVRGMDPKAK